MTKNARRKASVRKRAEAAGTSFTAAQDNSHIIQWDPMGPDSIADLIGATRVALHESPAMLDPLRFPDLMPQGGEGAALSTDDLGLQGRVGDSDGHVAKIDLSPAQAERERLLADAEQRIALRGPHPLVRADKPEHQAGLEAFSRRLGSMFLAPGAQRTQERADRLFEGDRIHALAERYATDRVASRGPAAYGPPPAPMMADAGGPEGRGWEEGIPAHIMHRIVTVNGEYRLLVGRDSEGNVETKALTSEQAAAVEVAAAKPGARRILPVVKVVMDSNKG